MNKWVTFFKHRCMENHVNFITIAFLICSAIINIILANKVADLRDNLSYIRAEGQLKIGSQVPKIDAKDMNGIDYRIEYSKLNIPTILYVFKPECNWCSRNLQNIKTIASQTNGKYRLIGLSLSSGSLKDYISQNDLVAAAKRVSAALGFEVV